MSAPTPSPPPAARLACAAVVLFVSYAGLLGGAERLLLDFATAVDQAALARPEGAPVRAALACPEGPLARAARAQNIKVFGLRSRELALRRRLRDRVLAAAGLAGHAFELERLARSLDPELVVAWGMRSAIAWRILRRHSRPVAFQQNDFVPGPLIGRLVRWAASAAELITVPSHAVAEDLDRSGRLGDRLRVIHPGVDVARLAADEKPVQPPEVLVLGALTAWKRPDIALDACALARLRRRDLRLRVLGAPLDGSGTELVERLRERARRPELLGAVEFVGEVEDPRPALAHASCLLHCAPREPFGIAVLEALAAGRPAIVPAAGGPAEVVDRSCGILYPPGDPVAAAQSILDVLADPGQAARMGAAGRARAGRCFDKTAAQAAYAGAVGALLGRRSRRGAAGRPGPAAPAELSVVTVTHNSATHLPALLRSLSRHIPGSRVIVVDCCSSDDSVAVARSCGAVSVLALDANLGFGAACNRGVAEVLSPVAALLNPDVELVDDSLLALAAEAMRRDRPERLLAPLVLDPDGTRQDSVYPAPTSPADLLRSLVPPVFLPGPLGVGSAPWRARVPRPVGWAVGCALLARTATLRRLGPFDERFFMFGEDLELGLRAVGAGVETWFWPEARIIHARSHSTRVAYGGEPFERLARARHVAVERRLGARRAAIDDAAQALTFSSRAALKRVVGRPWGRERRQLAALGAVWRSRGRGGSALYPGASPAALDVAGAIAPPQHPGRWE